MLRDSLHKVYTQSSYEFMKCNNFLMLIRHITNALQLEAARRRAVPIPFIFVSRAKFELAQPIRCRLRAFLLLIRYVTL